jgi:CheY-like chemotaxis protein/nitrogen-specific signal transduction histidine kinase
MPLEHNRPVEIICIPFEDKNDLVISAQVALDRTYNKKMEEELLRQMRKAEESNKLKSVFIANMSHEIRTPLNSIIGFSDILNELIQDDLHRNYLKSIKTSSKSLLTIINDILDISKIEAGRPELHKEAINLEKTVNDIDSIFKTQVKEKGLDWILIFKSEINAFFEVDEEKIKQIIINLLSNAIKFTEDGYIKFVLLIEKNEKDLADIYIDVEDSGIGIKEEDKERIFEIFTQAEDQDNKKYGGTGLGLTITKKLTELHNGKISVKSKLKEGSLFSVSFKDIHFMEFGGSHDTCDKTSRFEGQKVIIIDDVEENYQVTGGLLELYGLKVEYAKDGESGISKALNIRPDLILCDIKMPGISGFEVLNRIKNNPILKNISVIAFTAIDNEDGKMNSFDGYLRKPVNSKDLLTVLNSSIKKPGFSTSNDKLNPLSKNILMDAESVIEKVEKTILPLIEKLRERFSIKQVKLLRDEIKNIFIKYPEDDYVNEFLKDLDVSISSFDINRIKENIRTFEHILSIIKDKK